MVFQSGCFTAVPKPTHILPKPTRSTQHVLCFKTEGWPPYNLMKKSAGMKDKEGEEKKICQVIWTQIHDPHTLSLAPPIRCHGSTVI